jgi:glycine cleavage system aminomethyltransferase T
VPHRFVTFEVHGVTDADPLGNEPLFDLAGNLIGRATAGYYGHALGKTLGLGYVKPAHLPPWGASCKSKSSASASAPAF